MAAAKAKGPNKSAFIRQLLGRSPEANLKAVNAAWKKAGHQGSISNPLFYQVKPRPGGASAKSSTNGATATKIIEHKPKAKATKKRGPKKLSFIRELLVRNPDMNFKAVNEAWIKAGNKGGISSTSLYLVKSQINSTGAKGAPKAASASKPSAFKSTVTTTKTVPAHASAKSVLTGSASAVLEELEGEIDGLIFKLMGVGGLLEVEEALRRARRLIVRHHG
jgi:hypothetical protein